MGQILGIISLALAFIVIVVFLFIINNIAKKSYHTILGLVITTVFVFCAVIFSWLTFSTFSSSIETDESNQNDIITPTPKNDEEVIELLF